MFVEQFSEVLIMHDIKVTVYMRRVIRNRNRDYIV